MTREEMKAKLTELKDLKNMRDELSELITSIEDEIKAEMTAQETDKIVVDAFKVTWKPVTSSRFDSTAFKKADPTTYSQYVKETVSRRFVVS